MRRNVLALSGRAVEASGDVDVLLLDKTGTITLGNRQASEFIPMPGVTEAELAEVAQLASLADETPEGRSIVVLAKQYGIREHDMTGTDATFVPFTAQTRMSGVDWRGQQLRKGAGDAVIAFVRAEGGEAPPELQAQLDRIGREGGTPLAVARDSQILGVVYLKDTIKEGMRERFDQLRAMGIRTVMVTGDNRLTAAKIAEESGVDDFLAEATPEAKLALIKEQQAGGRLVAMTGDGTNDAPALAQADVGVAMNTGTQAAREAGNMVDLDSNPTKLIEIVEVGKQLLITRGALTTFSIANDVAKYFAILPGDLRRTYAASAGGKGPLHVLNIMSLGTPNSAILSAIIFNAIVIPLLIPLSLKGVRYRPIGASALLRRNLLDLRPRRHHRPVRRDQADRPDRPQPARRMRAASAIGYPAYALERRHRARAPLVSLRARARAAGARPRARSRRPELGVSGSRRPRPPAHRSPPPHGPRQLARADRRPRLEAALRAHRLGRRPAMPRAGVGRDAAAARDRLAPARSLPRRRARRGAPDRAPARRRRTVLPVHAHARAGSRPAPGRAPSRRRGVIGPCVTRPPRTASPRSPRARGHPGGAIEMTSAHSARGLASHLPRHGRRGRQDLPDAARGPGVGRERPRRRDRLPRAARTARRPRSSRATSRSSRGVASPTARRPSRRWTCPRSSRARRSSA